MNKLIALLLISTQLSLPAAFAKGKIQDEDVKSEAELISAGSDKTHLPNAQKVYVTANGINDTLHNAITNGAIGGGGGAGGVELLKDTGFEAATSPEFTNTGGTLTHVTTGANLLIGLGSATFQASATGQSIHSALHAVPNGLFGRSCAASVLYKGADANLKFQVVDGSANIIASQTLVVSTIPSTVNLSFICPSSGSIQWRVQSSASSAVIAVDQGHLGENSVVQVSQAQWIGNVTYSTAGTTSTVSTNSPTDFTQTGAVVTATGAISAAPGSLIGFTLSSMGPGLYTIVNHVTQECDAAGAAARCYSGMSSVTNSFSDSFEDINGQSGAGPTVMTGGQSFTQSVQVTSARGATTYRLVGQAVSPATSEFPGNTAPMSFDVYYFPSQTQTATNALTSAMSWSGYHTWSSGWDTTSTTYADPAVGVGIALIELTNRNFGSVVTEASGLPGITWTPTKIGRYWVCAGVNGLTSTTSDWGSQLVDGSNNLIDPGELHRNVGNTNTSAQICGIQNVASLGTSVTTKVRLASPGGVSLSISSSNIPAPSAAIRWSIVALDQSLPGPVLQNQIVSPSSGLEQIVRVTFAGNTAVTSACSSDPCVIASQSGNAVTAVNRAGTGHYLVHFAAGTFSAPPTCTAAITGTSNSFAVEFNGANTATLLDINVLSGASFGSLADDGSQIICMGPK